MNNFFGMNQGGQCGCGCDPCLIILLLLICNCGCNIDPCFIIILLLICGSCGQKSNNCGCGC